MENYLDKIMSNHVFNSESSEDLSYLYSEPEYSDNPLTQHYNENDNDDDNEMRGGRDKTENKEDPKYDGPTGGFPPISIVSAKEKEEEKSKDRRLATVTGKVSVSIKDILKSKK